MSRHVQKTENGSSGGRVLVVDDDRELLDLLAFLIGQAGLTAVLAESSPLALSALNTGSAPDRIASTPSRSQRSISQGTKPESSARGETYAASVVYSPRLSGLMHAPITLQESDESRSAFRIPWLTFPPTPITRTVRSGRFVAVTPGQPGAVVAQASVEITASTTRSMCESPIPTQSGSLTSRSLVESVIGSAPTARPKRRPAGDECSGT